MNQILFRAEIPFRRLDRRVTEQQLNLLKLPARGAAHPGCSAKSGPAASKPVPNPHAFGSNALDARDSGRQLRRQQPVVGGLDRQFAHGRDPYVDRNRTKSTALQSDTLGADGPFGEACARLSAVPLKELIQPEIVDSPGDRGGDAVEDERLQPVPIGCLLRQHKSVHF
jgi:hypothetical protein